MRKPIFLLLVIILLSACKEKIAEFIFNQEDIQNITLYSYQYDGDKIISLTEITHVLLMGQIMDTTIYKTTFEYNDKGLLEKELTFYDENNNPGLTIYSYDSNDSLICITHISEEGDTTRQTQYGYFPDGMKVILSKSRHLRVLSEMADAIIDSNADLSVLEELSSSRRGYDTIFSRYEYSYDNDLCKAEYEYDKDNHLTKITEYEYDNGSLMTVTEFSLFQDEKLKTLTRYYDYSNSKDFPDYFALDIKKDTIEKRIHKFENNNQILTINVSDFGEVISETYYENGQETVSVFIDKKLKYKSVYSYSYYENGDLKETKHYSEDLH